MNTGLADLVQLLFSLATSIVVLRFLMHLSKADYYNPITQGVVKATNPIVLPVQSVLRPQGRIDIASLVVALVLKIVGIGLALGMLGALGAVNALNIFMGGVLGVLNTLLDIYFFALIISIVLSWIAPQANHPGAILVYQITEPIMAPVRRFIPALGGLDLSPIFVFLGINLVKSVLLQGLAPTAGLAAKFVGF